MATVTIHDAKTNLSELIRRVEAGEEIIIARGKDAVAVLKSYQPNDALAKRLAGQDSMAGRFTVPPDHVLIGPMTDEEFIEEYGQDLFDETNPVSDPQP